MHGKVSEASKNVLQVGLSDKAVKQAALKKWISLVDGIDSLAVVHERNRDNAIEYVAEVEELWESIQGEKGKVFDLTFRNESKPDYDGIVRKLKRNKADGVVLAVSDIDAQNFIHALGSEQNLRFKPVYWYYPSGTLDYYRQLELAQRPGIGFGAQFFPRQGDKCTDAFWGR